MNISRYLLVIYGLLLLPACATYKGEFDFRVIKNIDYSSEGNNIQSGDLFLPLGNGQENYPIVIVVHGGGLDGGDKSSMLMVSKTLASHGIAAFSINYHLAPEYKHPKPYKDIIGAFKFLTLHAGEFQLDTSKFGLWGYSAGGYIVSYFALRMTENRPIEIPIKVVVSGGAPFDLMDYPSLPNFYRYLGGYGEDIPEKYNEASPLTHVTPRAPPFFLYHAIEDRLISINQAHKFKKNLKEMGVPVELHLVEFWGHTFTHLMSKEVNKKSVNFVKRYLQ